MNEVIRAVLNYFFYTKRFCTHQKHKTLQANKNKNAFKKHLREKNLLICFFAFLCFLCMWRKENKKKKIEKREKSPQSNVLKEN